MSIPNDPEYTAGNLNEAVSALKGGGVIAYPTEAVFGLGCDPHDEKAVQRIIDIKGREAHKGFILIASSQEQLASFIKPVSQTQQSQLDTHWPGPVTFVVPVNNTWENTLLTGYRKTLAVRVSSHPVVVQLCDHYGSAIVSTSANHSGEEALREFSQVSEQLGPSLDCVVEGTVGELAQPTQIYDLASGERLR